MKTVIISGTVGLDVTASQVRQQLDAANGQPVEIQIASPGGLVFDGLEIFNLIKNYPGQTTVKISGLAASMASYIACAGDRVTAEGNAVYMLHNPMGAVIGNQHDLTHTAGVLQGLADVLASTYSAKTGKPLAEIHSMMDSELWLYGQEIVDAHFADALLGRETLDKKTAVASARSKFTASTHDRRASGRAENLTKIAACVSEFRAAAAAPEKTPKQLADDLRTVMGMPKDFSGLGLTPRDVNALHRMGMSDDDIKKYATPRR